MNTDEEDGKEDKPRPLFKQLLRKCQGQRNVPADTRRRLNAG